MRKFLNTRYKFIVFVLILLFLFTISLFKSYENVFAFEQTPTIYDVFTFQELKTILDEQEASTNTIINLKDNLDDVNENIVIRGKVEIRAEAPFNIGVKDAFMDIKNGSVAIFRNININQNSSTNIPQTVLFRDNTKQGSAYFYSCNITTNNPSVLRATSINGRFFIHNTHLSGGNYSFNKGSVFVSGNSSFTSDIEATTIVYDFTKTEIVATPSLDSYTRNDKVNLKVSGDAVFYRGNSSETEKLKMKVYYTLDGTDPLFSDTRLDFTEDISLIVDRHIKAVMVSELFDNIYSAQVFEFIYDVNSDKTEGIVKTVEQLDEVSIRCKSAQEVLNLKEAVAIELEDGRNLYALVEWDLSTFDSTNEGVFYLYGDLILPYYVENPNNIKAVLKVNVYLNEIEKFVFEEFNIMQEGKNTSRAGYVLGKFSAKGGDEETYSYSFINDEFGPDNSKFEINVDQLLLKENLVAGEYQIHVKVTSASKSADKLFTFNVLEKGKEIKIVSNPYEDINWETVNFVKTATHTHTFYSSSAFEKSEWQDSAYDTVDERVQRYVDIGYGAVIITEHDYVALEEVGGKYSNPDILYIYGNELSKNYHMLYYGLSPYYDKKGQGSSVSNGMEGNLRNIQEIENSLVYFAHPNRSNTDPEHWFNLFNKYDNIYGIEVFNAGQALRNYSEHIWDYILTKSMPNRPIYGSASDDAHSNGAAGTGWTILLLDDSEMNSMGVLNALKNGNSFLGSICINPETDDDIMLEDIKGPVPEIKRIDVNIEDATITVQATNYHTIEWVSANGQVVATGETINLNDCYGVEKYIRVRIYGENGMIHSQPFGLEFGDEYYEGNIEDEKPDETEKPEDPQEPNEPEKPNSKDKKGCFGCIAASEISLFIIFSFAFIFARYYSKKSKSN